MISRDQADDWSKDSAATAGGVRYVVEEQSP